MQVRGSFVTLYDSLDVRGTDSLNAASTRKLIHLDVGSRAGRLRSGKWRRFSQNISVLRLGEQYLIRAEVAFRTGDLSTALADANRIHTRPGAIPITAGQLILSAILLEWQLVLAFEGFRVHDLK